MTLLISFSKYENVSHDIKGSLSNLGFLSESISTQDYFHNGNKQEWMFFLEQISNRNMQWTLQFTGLSEVP